MNIDNSATPKTSQNSTISVMPIHPPAASVQHLYTSLPPLKPSWSNQTPLHHEEIRLCKILCQPLSSKQPMAISHSIIIHSDLTWTVFVHGHKVNPTNRSPLSSIPTPITSASLAKLVDILDMASICPGHPDDNFLKMADSRKGKFTSVSEEVVAFTDDHIPVTFNGSTFSRTLRTAACDILVHGGKCDACTAYRPQLRSMYSRWSRKTSTPPKFGNNRYLNTPQKQAKLKNLAPAANPTR